MLTPYAGQPEKPDTTPYLSRQERSLMMFRAGKDTLFIAEHFKVREATVLRWITQERSSRLDLPNPYLSQE